MTEIQSTINPDRKVLIAAPIGGMKQYSINLWFDWIASQDWKNYEIMICVNGDDADLLLDKLNQVTIRDKHGQIKEIKTLILRQKGLTTIQKITYSRELIRRYFKTYCQDYSHLFFLDTDTIPANKNAIERLMSWDKQVISGLYCYKNSRQPVAIGKISNTNPSLEELSKYVENNEIMEVWGFGFGCLLLSSDALNQPFDYSLFGQERTDDFGFIHVLEQQGIKRWLDPFVLCKHFDTPENEERFSWLWETRLIKPRKPNKTDEVKGGAKEGDNDLGSQPKDSVQDNRSEGSDQPISKKPDAVVVSPFPIHQGDRQSEILEKSENMGDSR